MSWANNCFALGFLLLSFTVPTITLTRRCKHFNRGVCVEKLLTACRLRVVHDADIRGNLCVQGNICNNGLNERIDECCERTNNNIDITRESINDKIDECCERTNNNIDITRETILDELNFGGGTITCSLVELLTTCDQINNTDFGVIQWLKAIFWILNHKVAGV